MVKCFSSYLICTVNWHVLLNPLVVFMMLGGTYVLWSHSAAFFRWFALVFLECQLNNLNAKHFANTSQYYSIDTKAPKREIPKGSKLKTLLHFLFVFSAVMVSANKKGKEKVKAKHAKQSNRVERFR